MPSNYPRWDQSKYNCINPDLSGVHAMLKLEKYEKEHRELETELAQLRNRNLEGEDLRESLESTIKKLVEERKDSHARFRELVENFRRDRSAYERTRDPVSYQNSESAAFSLLCSFMSFDYGQFLQIYREFYGDELKKNPTARRRKDIERALATNRTKQSQVWSNTKITMYFKGEGARGIPNRWGSLSVRNGNTKREISKQIYREFMKDWRERARLFRIPVTINGVAISTLPREMRESWHKAYRAVGLHEIKKNPIYMPRKCDIVDASESMPMPVVIDD